MTTPTLDLVPLPLAASMDLTKPVAQVRDAWRATISYLDQLRTQPGVSYSTVLGVKLDTARYAAALALEAITRWEGGGGTGAETATAVSDLAGPAEAFKTALTAAQAAWVVEFPGTAAAATPSFFTRVTAPRETSWYLLWGGAAFVLYLLTMKR